MLRILSEKKKRLFYKIINKKKLVLFEVIKRKLTGHSDNYVKVVVPGPIEYVNTIKKVKISHVAGTHVEGINLQLP